MTSFDILITSHTNHAAYIISQMSAFLKAKSYRITQEKCDDYWVWIPIVSVDTAYEDLKCLDNNVENPLVVIPLLLNNALCPEQFGARNTISIPNTNTDIHQCFSKLNDHLINGKRLVEKLRSLKAEYRKLSQHQADGTQRITKYVDDLHTRINYLQSLIRQPRVIGQNNQDAIEIGIQTLLEKSSQLSSIDDQQRTVGNPPQGRSQAFKGRESELALISNYVLDNTNTRIISILGQGGVGKTALACHVLDTLLHHDAVYGVLYLSAASRNQQFTLERLFMMTGEVFGDDVQDILDRVWKNEQMALETRIDYLIDQYVDQRCLIMFDNLEDSLSHDGQFDDNELSQFLKQFLQRKHQSKLIVTSRVPINLTQSYRAECKIVPLSVGLSRDYAIELLHEFDSDNTLGFKQASDDKLAEIVDMTQGFPRALEAVAGILANDPQMTLEELRTTPLKSDDRVSDWVNQAESILDADQRMVMQALSIFARPVDETAIRFLLDPYIVTTGINIPFTLDRLEYGRYITRNHVTGDISIHPLDKEFNYNTIQDDNRSHDQLSAGELFFLKLNILPPDEDTVGDTPFNRRTLEKRAADYYARLRDQPNDWQTIHDLQPYFLEYDHRLRACDYDTGFTMLITVYNLLKLSGFSRRIVDMITPLIHYLPDTYLVTCYNMLGMAYDDLGRYQDALDCHLVALPLAQIEDNRPAEAAHLSGIGLQYSNLGEYDKALENYEQALEISREQGRRKQERGILNNMAVVYNSIGRKLEGLAYYEESLEIAREIVDQQGIAVTLANIGDVHGALGDVDKTIEFYQESIEIYADIGDKLGRGVTIGKMGNTAIMIGSYDDALKLLGVAIGIAQAVGNRMWGVLHQADMAAVYAHQGEIERGLELLEGIIPQAQEIGSPILINYTHSLMASVLLLDGQFNRAADASRVAIQYVNPANRHYEYALYGLILVRLHDWDAAQEAFTHALDHAAELLDNTPNLFSPKYSRGLALMGLALVTDDMTYAEDAKQAYIAARQNCDAKGVVTREMRKLKLLTGTTNSDDDLFLLDSSDLD